MTLKHINILAFFSILLIAFYFIIKKFRPMILIKDAFRSALSKFSEPIVRNCERLYRLETNNFKSNQFLKTFSPGMEKFGNNFPYGWQSLDNALWKSHPLLAPVGALPFCENRTGKTKWFLKFPSAKAAVYTVCTFLQLHNNNPGRWYSLSLTSQATYNTNVAKFKTDIVDEILKT